MERVIKMLRNYIVTYRMGSQECETLVDADSPEAAQEEVMFQNELARGDVIDVRENR